MNFHYIIQTWCDVYIPSQMQLQYIHPKMKKERKWNALRLEIYYSTERLLLYTAYFGNYSK